MNYSTYRYTLDIHSTKSQIIIPVLYMDTWVKVYFNLTDGGKPYRLDDVSKAVFYGNKPGETCLVQDCEIVDNNTRILYTFSDQTATEVGDTLCEIRLYSKEGKQLTSPSFIIRVAPRVIDDDDIIESDSERSAVDRILASEERIEAAATKAEEEAKKVEDSLGDYVLREEMDAKLVEVGYKVPTEGLAYYTSDGLTYTCTGRGTATAEDIVIANEIDGKPVTGVSQYAFCDETNIRSLYLNDNTKNISPYAFAYCTLKEVRLPEGVVIHDSAFQGTDIVNLTIPENASVYASFTDCANLETVYLPKSATVKGNFAFAYLPKYTIYTDAAEKPDNWVVMWNYTNAPVIWDAGFNFPSVYNKMNGIGGGGASSEEVVQIVEDYLKENPPEDGKSAYQIALDNGFEGSETEWLASLQGKDGANGKNGRDGLVLDTELVQNTGNSETAVMSQKATTDAIKSANEYDETVEENITDTLTLEEGYMYSTALKHFNQGSGFACTTLIPVASGDKFKISGKYGYVTPLVAEFDSTQTMVSYSITKDGGTANAVDQEYTVPTGISYIAVNTRDTRYNPVIVKKESAVTVKRRATENAVAIGNLSKLFVENKIANGNFSSADGWSTLNGTLTVSENIGKLTPNRTNINVGIQASFGEYSTGDKVFFKARIKAPKGEGGSAQQNRVSVKIRNNSSTGMKYAVDKGLIFSKEWTDYYGIIEFDGADSTNPAQFVATYNSVERIPYDAVIEFRDIIAVNLTETFGAGNEPSAETFYSLLDGLENKYIDGKVNLFSTDANIRRIYNDFKATTLTEDITVTVGEGGDFATLNKAIEYLSNFYPIYKKGGVKCEVKILAGTVINEQIYANQIDLQYITITAEAGASNTEVIDIDGTSHTMVIVDVDASFFGNTANAHDSRGNYPFIAGENAAKLPTIGCVFRLLPDTVESGKTICGMLCNRGSEGVVLVASGFDGFNDGCIANNESSITIREGISRNMTRWGVHARHNGEVSARSCVCTNCGIGACADRIGDLDVREAVLNGSKVAIECNNISRANANGCHAQNCGASGGYVVMVAGGGIANCGALDTANYVGTLYNIATNTLTANGIIFV